MSRNVGSADRGVRIGLGALAGLVSVLALAGSVSLPTVLAPVLGAVALILLVTGLTSFCGLYAVLGVDTCDAGSR
jgi:hypothetical protein